MILTLLILIPLVGGILAWLAGRANNSLPRWIALVATLLHLGLGIGLWLATPVHSGWMIEVNVPWVPSLGISYHLALDGLSLLLVLLTGLLGVISVLASWGGGVFRSGGTATEHGISGRGIEERVGYFHFMLLWILAAITGVFLAIDLFLFYFFWEMTLIPLYFIIGIWGHENRIYATIKFFIFTQASSLFMLLGILGLYFINGHSTGTYTFDYNTLIHVGATLPFTAALWLSLGFLFAFIVKLPAVPFHTWLPDAHTEAPTAGSVILAGLVLKLGAYGVIRFTIPLFPTILPILAPWMMLLGVIGILYGALVAFGQTDFKRLVAYTSVSHMGFVLLGVYAWNQYALQGAVIVMLAHGISTGALFVIAGALQDRTHTREMSRMGGLWDTIPRMSGNALLFAVASLGLPGLGNFVGEILVLIGVYQANVTMAILATLGFIVSTIYSLWLIQRTFQGPNRNGWRLPDLDVRETLIMASLIAAILWLGIYPTPVLNTAQPALQTLQQATGKQTQLTAPSPGAAADPGGIQQAQKRVP
jgi:NADH-quinone oxidoreductase subunit M